MKQAEWFYKLKVKKFIVITGEDGLTVRVETVWGGITVESPSIELAIREALRLLIQNAKNRLLSPDTNPDLRQVYTARIAAILAAWQDAGEEGEP